MTIRPIRPEDEPLMVKFHETLSERSVYLRYFQPMKLSQRTAHERLTRICFIDYDREMALVRADAIRHGEREILGVGRLTKIHGTNDGEVAVLISDKYQGRGLGKELLARLLIVGADEKLAATDCRHSPRQSGRDAHLREAGLQAEAFARRRSSESRIRPVGQVSPPSHRAAG